ncbi:MAG: helix-turn-helix transcriptional regulator [Leptolyngbyaceae cyanobacterium MO_188.B28]|nr:helix-turn-helix transcriptional regulator [Leptolyngbyaceae cyanobacterium MO_188.B28]
MVVSTSNLTDALQTGEAVSPQIVSLFPPLSQYLEPSGLKAELIQNLIDGVIILTDQKQLIYANARAHKILEQLTVKDLAVNSGSSSVPDEIWHICQSLIRSRRLFPNQHWFVQSNIFIEDSAMFRVKARWLHLETIDDPCLLLTIADRHQAIHNIVNEEAEKYDLTPREKEVWLLHRSNNTYKEIAVELNITPNTVKKHMRSIHAKQKKL